MLPLYRKTLALAVVALSLVFCATAQKKNHFYFGISPFAGGGFQFSHNSGTVSTTIPWSATDAGGNSTSAVLVTQPKQIYFPLRTDINFMAIELGLLRYFIRASVSGALEANHPAGFRQDLAAGLNWYVHGRKEHYREPEKRAFTIKTSLHFIYNADEGLRNIAMVGSLNNTGKTVHVLGIDAGPTFTPPTTRNHPNPTTYNATHSDLYFVESEWAVLPTVSLTNNTYRARWRWELNAGYSFPIYDKGGIMVYQDDGATPGGGNSLKIGGPVNIHMAPYRMGGPYVSVYLYFTGNWWR